MSPSFDKRKCQKLVNPGVQNAQKAQSEVVDKKANDKQATFREIV